MTVLVSGGRSVSAGKRFPFPTSSETQRGPSAGAIPLNRGGYVVTYDAMFRSQPWVYSVVTKLIWGASRLPLQAFTYDDDGDSRARDRASGLAVLLRKPRPRTSQMKWKQAVWYDALVHGKHLTMKYRKAGAGSAPTELWPVPWSMVQPVSDASGVIGFNVVIEGRSYSIGLADCLYFELPGGVSPLDPLARTLALEDAAIEYQGSSLEHGVTPRGAFVSDKKFDDRTLPRLRAELAKLYAGPENGGKFGLFDQNLRWEQMGQSAVDAELIAQRKLSREEVCSVYDMSPPLVGILDRATFNNVELLHTMLYVDSLGPKVELFESEVQAQIVDDEPSWDGLFVEHNMAAVLKPDPEKQARTSLMEQQSSTTTIDERRRLRNLPALKVPGVTDTVLVPVNMTPAGSEPGATDESQTDPAGASLTDQLVLEAVRAGNPPPASDSEDTLSS